MATHTQELHHHHHGAALIVAAQSALSERGERWTSLRADVFATLIDLNRAASAYEITEALSAKRSKRIAANSVYRILDLFVASNLAKRVEVANAYIVNSHPGCIHDCIFLLCEKCGQVLHLDNDDLAQQLRGTANIADFTPLRPVLEIVGLCNQCTSA